MPSGSVPAAGRGQTGARHQDRGGRSAADRDLRNRRSASRHRAGRRRGAVRVGPAGAGEGGRDRPRLCDRAYGWARTCAERRARHRRGRGDAVAARRYRPIPRFVRAHAARADSVQPGREPVLVRHRQSFGDPELPSRQRPHRQTRRRSLLADRPAQRDGWARGRRACQPARRAPAFRTVGSRPAAALLVGTQSRDQAGSESGRAVRRGARRAHSRLVDSRHQPAGQHAARDPCPRGARSLSVRRRVRRHRPQRHGAVGACAAARGGLGREGRHRHQQRAVHLTPARAARTRRQGQAGLVAVGASRAAPVRQRRVRLEEPGRDLPRACCFVRIRE